LKDDDEEAANSIKGIEVSKTVMINVKNTLFMDLSTFRIV